MAREPDNIRETSMPPMPTRFTTKRMAIAVALVAVYWGCVQITGFSPAALADGMPALWGMGRHMIPPDVEILPELWKPFLETLYIGVLATIIGSALAIPVGFMAASNMSHPVVYYPVRMVLTVFRAVSEIIWALLFVVAVGLGPMAGILALIVFAVGVQSKLVAEAVEAVDPGPLEAMRATGARPWKVFLYGAWPQVLPLYLSFALYFWDHNTRQATILGFVGAGGLGQQLIWDINVYEFEKATTSVLLIILLITIIDRLCLYLRKKIL